MAKLTKLQKMEKRSKTIVGNEEKRNREQRNQRVKDYIEHKMIRGYTREQATHMAKELIDKQW